MVYLKACPRCRGDLALTEDSYGRFLECLQCGYLRDVEEPGLVSAVGREEREAA